MYKEIFQNLNLFPIFHSVFLFDLIWGSHPISRIPLQLRSWVHGPYFKHKQNFFKSIVTYKENESKRTYESEIKFTPWSKNAPWSKSIAFEKVFNETGRRNWSKNRKSNSLKKWYVQSTSLIKLVKLNCFRFLSPLVKFNSESSISHLIFKKK